MGVISRLVDDVYSELLSYRTPKSLCKQQQIVDKHQVNWPQSFLADWRLLDCRRLTRPKFCQMQIGKTQAMTLTSTFNLSSSDGT